MPLVNLCAVVVTYNPIKEKVQSLLNQLKHQVRYIILVDNGSSGKVDDFIDPQIQNIIQENLQKNLGIAAAQNIGIRKAIELKSDAVIFFDQDSVIEENFVCCLNEELGEQDVNIVAPVFFDGQKKFGYKIVDILPSGRRIKYLPNELLKSIDVSTVISSGMLVKISVFDQVGFFEEGLFIDYVDTEWCLRCVSNGIVIRINPRAIMRHSIGDKSLQFLNYRIPVHSPLRRYYRIRNAFHLLRMSHVPNLMAVREIFFGFIHQLMLIICEAERKEYILYYIKAVRDGIGGIYGPLEN